MAHYAEIDSDNIVTQVFVGKDENDLLDINWETYYSREGFKIKKTSYNTHGGVHLLGGTPLRKNYAGIGFTYDEERDAFIPPKPFTKWILDEDTCLWKAPIPYPQDGKGYVWNDNKGEWE
jgi:hypothetical protein